MKRYITYDCIEWDRARNSTGYGVSKSQLHGSLQLVHRLAWAEVYGPIPAGMCVCHKCDNPPCFNVDHLFLGTEAENLRDRDRKGHQAKGARNGQSKLTETNVRTIRKLLAHGLTQRAVGNRFGVAEKTISDIVTRKTWRHANRRPLPLVKREAVSNESKRETRS